MLLNNMRLGRPSPFARQRLPGQADLEYAITVGHGPDQASSAVADQIVGPIHTNYQIAVPFLHQEVLRDAKLHDSSKGEPKPEGELALSEEKFEELAAREEFLLSITEKGFGARSSAYDYRITGRGGQGLINMVLSKRQDHVVAVFPVTNNDQIMLVTDGGTVIRCPVHDIRMARRPSQGVVVFKVEEGEHVVSVARLPDMGEANGEAEDGGGDAGGSGPDTADTSDTGPSGTPPGPVQN